MSWNLIRHSTIFRTSVLKGRDCSTGAVAFILTVQVIATGN
ncbi:hypothetical protein [Fictibacillus barbaricus]|nr:hypothetical protein [Fictibacillus barbaricus]